MTNPPPTDPMRPLPPERHVAPPADKPPADEPPTYKPGYAPLPPDDPPTAQFPAQPGYAQPEYDHPPPPPAPRRSNIPLIAVVVAIALLLCAGAATASALMARNMAARAKEAVTPVVKPTPTTKPPDLPNLPSTKKITVTYEVTGNGPAEIVYTEKLGEKPKRLSNVKLPWRLKTTMDSAALISVTAVRTGLDEGKINCRASVDGAQVAQGSHQGAFAAVTCTKLVFN